MRWSSDDGRSYREIVRQQYNFNPPENTLEIEDYEVDLAWLTVLELSISPDIRGEDGPQHQLLSCASHNSGISSRSLRFDSTLAKEFW